MTDEDWAKIEPLAKARESARCALENWKMQNTPAELRQYTESMVKGRRLTVEFVEADTALNAAIAAYERIAK